MDFASWEPHYREILEYFGFSREDDETAARLLGALISRDDLPALSMLTKGRDIVVCGNAPSLSRELGKISKGSVIFAADAAAEVLFRHHIRPDAVFTDLDGAADQLIQMNNEGTIVVIHAHGDNISLLKHWVKRFSGPIVATTQSTPLAHVHNFGGFSDGDRAAFAANALGARSVSFAGFDLDDRDVDPVKRGKLVWARKLLSLIGYEV